MRYKKYLQQSIVLNYDEVDGGYKKNIVKFSFVRVLSRIN